MGWIVKTDRQTECVEFYRDVLGLRVLFETDFLTCFDVGGVYLMVEPRGNAMTDSGDSLVIRLNVADVLAERRALESKGIECVYSRFDWGEILMFQDPAGTKIELKDAIGFDAQVRNGSGDLRCD